MKICLIGKYPPIEGGVSAQTYWTCHLLARAGHQVFVVTNADETEPEHREWFLPGDTERLEAVYPSGGSVRVSFTQAQHDDDLYYIPHGRPTTTRLASVAAEVVRGHGCDLLIGWYLEPYAIAASLVAAWTGRPYLIRHAGSDVHDLAAQPELGPAYREVMRAAVGVVSSTLNCAGLGLPDARIFGFPGLFLPEEFAATGPAMDLIATARLLSQRGCPSVLRTEPLPPGIVLIGSYGKLGVSKGTIDLVQAVSRARMAGNMIGLALAGGGPGWDTVIDAIRAEGLEDVTITLPMLAPWRIPSFIRACDAVAFLERDFEVAQHLPAPPVEVLACGRPLLLSTDAAPATLPCRSADDPLFGAVETVNPRDPVALTAAVVSVVACDRPRADRIAARLRPASEVARWYATVFEQVLAPPAPRGTGRAGRDSGFEVEVERLLTRHSPALVRIVGGQAVQRHLEGVDAAPNALAAAYAVADRCLPQIRAAIDDTDGEVGAWAQLALAEHHALWTRVDVESLAGVPSFTVPVQRVPVLPAEPDRLDALFPVTSSWLRLADFGLDAFAHLRAVAAGKAVLADPAAPGQGAASGMGQVDGAVVEGRSAVAGAGAEQVLLFHKAPNLIRTISRVSPAIRTLLSEADGTRSLRSIAETLGADGERLTPLLNSVRDLHKAGVLSFRRDLLAG